MFDHEIPLNQESRITIIHGPNGVGKTVLMQMVNGLLRGDFELLGSTPFEQLHVEFVGGDNLTAEKNSVEGKLSIRYEDGAGTEYLPFEPVILDKHNLIVAVRRHLPDQGLLLKLGEPYWLPNDILEFHIGKYVDGDDLAASLMDREGLFDWWYEVGSTTDLYPTCPFAEMPNWFGDIRYGRHTYIVEIHRLLRDKDEGFIVNFDSPFESTNAFWVQDVEPAVQSLPQELKFTFFKQFQRAHSARDMSQVSKTQEASLIFADIVNERILFKFLRLKFDNSGFELVDDRHRVVPQSVLSSGEQQLLILYYKLLFEFEPDTLVMIDEPELSMNVVWQRNFLKDLQRIIELRKFDVLIATHSPEVIYDKWDWTVALGAKVDD